MFWLGLIIGVVLGCIIAAAGAHGKVQPEAPQPVPVPKPVRIFIAPPPPPAPPPAPAPPARRTEQAFNARLEPVDQFLREVQLRQEFSSGGLTVRYLAIRPVGLERRRT